VRQQQIVPALDDGGALLGRRGTPGREGGHGRIDRGAGIGSTAVRDGGEHLAGGRVGDLQHAAVGRSAPLGADQLGAGHQVLALQSRVRESW
jgi:hypothetical protein